MKIAGRRSPHIPQQVAVAFILLLGFALRLYRLDAVSLWFDELGQASVAFNGVRWAIAGARMHSGAAPADYLITWLIFQLAHNDFVVRLPAAMLGTMTIALVYRLGRELFDKPTSILAALLLTVAPLHLRYSQEVRFYALFTCLTVALTIAFIIALRRQDWPGWIIYTAILIVSLYSHYYTTIVVLVHGVVLLAILLFPTQIPLRANGAGKAELARWKTIGCYILTCLVAALAFLPWFFYAVVQESGSLVGTHPELTFAFVKDAHASLVLEQVPNSLTGVRYWPVWLYGSLAVLGCIGGLAYRKTRLGVLLNTAMVLVSFLLIVAALRWINYFFAARQLLFILPFYLLLVSLGAMMVARLVGHLARGRQHEKVLPSLATAMLVLIMVLSLSSSIDLIYNSRRETVGEDWKAALAFIAANAQPDDVVIVPKMLTRQYLSYYASDWIERIENTDSLTEIQEMSEAHDAAWILVYTLVTGIELGSEIDQRGAIGVDFGPGMSVYYWRPGQEQQSLRLQSLNWTSPENYQALEHLARQYRFSGMDSAAAVFYGKAASLAPDDQLASGALMEQATILREQGEVDEALEGYQRAIDRWPANGEAWVRLGEGLIAADQVETAVAALQRGKSIVPDHYWAHRLLGLAYGKKGQYQKAAESFRIAVTLQPEYASTYELLGDSLLAMGDIAGAVGAYRRYLEIAPDGEHAAALTQRLANLRGASPP